MSMADIINITSLLSIGTIMLLVVYIILTVMLNNSMLTQYADVNSKNILSQILLGSDYTIPFIFFSFSLVSIIAALNIRTYPFMYVFVILMLALVSITSDFFSKMYRSVTSNQTEIIEGKNVSSFREDFPYTTMMFNNLETYSLALTVLVAIASYIGIRG